MGWLLSLVVCTVIEGVAVGVVAVDFEDFRDVAASWSALDLNHAIERVSNVALDSSVEELDAALQHATREAGEALLRRIGVNRFADEVIENEMSYPVKQNPS